jgi:GNAT superfamily N-acetyltransferase
MPEFTLKPATSAEHRTAVFRLRYDVYVKEMGRTQRYADHSRSQVEEPMDTAGHVVAAFAGADVVGTVRSNLLRLTSSTGLYEDLYDFAALQPPVRAYTSLTTKLVVHRDFRNTSLASQLARAAYRYGLENGVEEDFIDCNAHLVHFFLRLGYTEIKPITHPEYGVVVLLRLRLRDRAQLSTVRSPFLRDLRAFEHRRQGRERVPSI